MTMLGLLANYVWEIRMDWEPRASAKGKAVYVQVGLWMDDNDAIHVTNNGKKHPFHTYVVHRDDERYGHHALYDHLSRLIEAAE